MRYESVAVLLLAFVSQGVTDGRTIREERRSFAEIDKFVTFRLYTRKDPRNGVVLPIGDKKKLLASGFNGSLPTVMCTHGYFDTPNASWVLRIKQDIFQEEDLNFITLDYSQSAKNLLYNQVVSFTKEAGRRAGQFLMFLQNDGKFDIKKAHLIGHSLGAQLLGFAATVFPSKKTIGRITGLDPAGPLFENAPESERLNPDAAKVVDVIHTCRIFTGMKKPVGTIDFYPNGGFGQPGCGDFDLNCNHARSRQYFYQTISTKNRNKYTAKKCETLQNAINGTCKGSTATMGYHLAYSSPGIYYLKIE